jgi:RNA polymerase sigma-70 factor (ECF subfamily)
VSIDPEVGADGRWIEALYHETGPRLLSYLAQRLVDAGSAEDLLQETFVAALRHPERLRSASSSRAYLFGIARNLAATASRKAMRAAGPLPGNALADDTSPDPRLEWLRETIGGLKPEFREVLELRLQYELSYEEIAETLAVPLGTVRSRLHYAINQVRRTLRQGRTISTARKEQS